MDGACGRTGVVDVTMDGACGRTGVVDWRRSLRNDALGRTAKRTIDEMNDRECGSIVLNVIDDMNDRDGGIVGVNETRAGANVGNPVTCRQQRRQPKRFKQSRDLSDTLEDEEDLLRKLDITYMVDRDNEMNCEVARNVDGDVVRTAEDGRLLCEHDECNVQVIASLTTAAVKRAILERERWLGSAREDEEDTIMSDEDGILMQLDVAYEMENAYRPDISYGTRGNGPPLGSVVVNNNCENESNDLNVQKLAAVSLVMETYKCAFADERLAYLRSMTNRGVDGLDNIDELSLRSVIEPARRKNRDRQRTFRERLKSKDGSSDQFGPVSDKDRASAVKRLQGALGSEGLDECVCVACDELVLCRAATRKEASDRRFTNQMRCSLGEVDVTLPQRCIQCSCVYRLLEQSNGHPK